ncbi:transmembrane protein 272-like [Notolabrus celidotus]|uniref:transmembrane protein 272-like n=1 Tax=Notolabrus celidotus TaxID=1203425 RepID=UPI00148FD935|nr:transmembrane protein 272-like [Notolabrus celidotus]
MDESPQVEFRPQSAVLISTTIVVNITWWIVMVAAIALGTLYLDQCPVQPKIPVYLIVFGTCSILALSLTYSSKSSGKNRCTSILISSCMTLLHIFNFGWFIAGSCWIYPVYPPNYTPGTAQYCHKTTYQFAFIVTTLVWVTISLVFFCGCCFSLLTCGRTVRAGRRLIPNRSSFYGAISEEPTVGDV